MCHRKLSIRVLVCLECRTSRVQRRCHLDAKVSGVQQLPYDWTEENGGGGPNRDMCAAKKKVPKVIKCDMSAARHVTSKRLHGCVRRKVLVSIGKRCVRSTVGHYAKHGWHRSNFVRGALAVLLSHLLPGREGVTRVPQVRHEYCSWLPAKRRSPV